MHGITSLTMLLKINSQNVKAYRNISFFYSDVCILPSDYTGSLVPWYTVTNNCSAEKNTNFKKQHLIFNSIAVKAGTVYVLQEIRLTVKKVIFDICISKRAWV
jgi:hypothetical protein